MIAYNQTGELGPYIMQSTLLLIAPVLFAASLYMTLGRVITGVRGQRHALVSPRWTTGIFVAGDVISFLVQGSGAGLMAQTGEGSDPKMATNIITGGLVFQIIIFAIFVLATAIFHRRFSRDGPGVAAAEGIPWNQTLRMLYLTSALVMVRNIFRVAEFVQGNDGYLLSVEWPVYVFDAVLMSITMGLFYWWYPADIGRAVRQIGARNYPADDSEMMPVK